jgi:hypothetical protein
MITIILTCKLKSKLVIDSEKIKTKLTNLVVKLNLWDTKGLVAVVKANDSEVDSEGIAGANVDKKMMAKAPKKKSLAKVH